MSFYFGDHRPNVQMYAEKHHTIQYLRLIKLREEEIKLHWLNEMDKIALFYLKRIKVFDSLN